MKSVASTICLAMVLLLASSCERAREKASHWVSSATEKAAERVRDEVHEELDSLDAYLEKPIQRTEPVFPLSAPDYPLLKGYALYSAKQLPDSLLTLVDKYFFLEPLVKSNGCLALIWPYQICAGEKEAHIYDASYTHSFLPSPIPPAAKWHFHELLRGDVQGEWFFAQTYDISTYYTGAEPPVDGFVALNMRTHQQWFWLTEEQLIEGAKRESGKTPILKDWHSFRNYYQDYR